MTTHLKTGPRITNTAYNMLAMTPSAVLVAIFAVALLLAIGCSPATKFTKTPFVAQIPDGVQTVQADTFDIDLQGFAGEMIVADTWSRNITYIASVDSDTAGFALRATFYNTGELKEVSAEIASRTAMATTPTQAAWEGLGKVIGEDGLSGIFSTIAEQLRKAFVPVPDVEINTAR